MRDHISGLHHVTAMAADPQTNNDFYTRTLGLRRIKKTVNFDAPDVYHLYYGDAVGTPGSVMTYFPFPDIGPGKRGAGEVTETAFAVPTGALGDWAERFAAQGVNGLRSAERFGAQRLEFAGPDGEGLALVEVADDARAPYSGGPVPAAQGIHGFHGVTMRLRDGAATGALLSLMGFERAGTEGALTRYVMPDGNGAGIVDTETAPDAPPARLGAGSVHHVAFAVADRAAQAAIRAALVEAGQQVTPVIDRDYFWAIYFRAPGGVLFEIATHEPGFDRDESLSELGTTLRIPDQHAHLRARLERVLPPIRD